MAFVYVFTCVVHVECFHSLYTLYILEELGKNVFTLWKHEIFPVKTVAEVMHMREYDLMTCVCEST